MKTPLGTEVDLSPGHIVLDGIPALCERGTAAPLFSPCLLWPRSPISATADLLLPITTVQVSHSENADILLHSLHINIILHASLLSCEHCMSFYNHIFCLFLCFYCAFAGIIKVLSYLICSIRISVHCQWGGFLSLVTMTSQPSHLSKRGTKHIFLVNLAQIRSAVPDIVDSQTKKIKK